ncbi:MAG: polyprenyl diphosphate synthase [Pseudomonadota bacterium]
MSAAAPAPRDPEIPVHVAVIMDGNGRWARARGKSRSSGHRAGVTAARNIVRACAERGVQYLTLFAFSSENWNRPPREVSLLMKLFVEALQREVRELDRNDVVLRFIGDRSRLNAALQRQMAEGEATTANNRGLQLNIAVAYGGRWDLVQAARNLARDAAAGKLEPEAINESSLGASLCLGDQPSPDLFIRTGGESRISNFLLWHAAYSELYFSELCWPDFTPAALDEALACFAGRHRRFGRTSEQLQKQC